MSLFVRSFVIAFSAPLPVVNPLGSALIFLDIVREAPAPEFRTLARKVSLSTVLFLLIVELTGAALLTFLGYHFPWCSWPADSCWLQSDGGC